MSRKHSRPAGSLVIELLLHSGIIALVIALMIPVLLNRADGDDVRKVAQKSTQKQQVLHTKVVSTRIAKL